MKITNLKYNLEFGNLPEGKLFIEKYKELSLDISLLGKYFSFKNELKERFQDCIGQLTGLIEHKNRTFESIKTNKKLPYLQYCVKYTDTQYYLVFKIINKKYNNDIGYLTCSIPSLFTDMELI